MSKRARTSRPRLLTSLLSCGLSLGATAAYASDPLPGDAIAPPVNVNIGLFYNAFTDAGDVGSPHGGSDSQDTHISTDVSVARYIRTFDVAGLLSGVDVFEEYTIFLGGQRASAGYLPSAAPGLLPPIGRAYASLSTQGGFGQPNIGVFTFPINDPATGTYLVLHPWIAPPISSFNKDYYLNPAQNTWTYEMEVGFRKTLIGTPTTRNLTIELWGEAYLFSPNNDSAYNTPAIYADNLSPLYASAHEFVNQAIPGSNPIRSPSSTPASFHEEPSEEFRVYLPYEFYPATDAVIAPGLFQSFGGKQYYNVSGAGKVDTLNRTNETQLRLVLSSFVTPTLNVNLVGEYDVANRGGPLQRVVLLRLAKFF
jgi:Putative MetA-pathway of phenol degradation